MGRSLWIGWLGLSLLRAQPVRTALAVASLPLRLAGAAPPPVETTPQPGAGPSFGLYSASRNRFRKASHPGRAFAGEAPNACGRAISATIRQLRSTGRLGRAGYLNLHNNGSMTAMTVISFVGLVLVFVLVFLLLWYFR
jgi:hypothetical protein